MIVALVFAVAPATVAAVRGAEVEVLDARAPWRVFATIAPPMVGTAARCEPRGEDGELLPSPFPPVDWTDSDFDDGVWGRYHDELGKILGGYGYWQSPELALLCLRTRFDVVDPAAVTRLDFTLAYRGGAVVYVNGREVARGHLPVGPRPLVGGPPRPLVGGPPRPLVGGPPRQPLALADDYPIEAYVTPDGKTLLRRADVHWPTIAHRDRYEMRIRTLKVSIPNQLLRQGPNVLAIELHRTANRHPGWSTLGFCGGELIGEGDGLISYRKAAGKLRLWNADPTAIVTSPAPGKPPSRPDGAAGSEGPRRAEALKSGNPFDPLRPLRLVAARNGACSGQVVLSCATGVRGVIATLSELSNGQGRSLPAEAVRIRYAAHPAGAGYCDTLLPAPVDGVANQPVCVLLDVPKRQSSGWYTGKLSIAANGRKFAVPVQVLIGAWALPDPKDYVSHCSLLQSPDSVALKYGVKPFSRRHFELMEKSLQAMGQLGNDVVFIPVIHGTHLGHRTGMIRWVKTGDAYRPDTRAMQQYLDLYAKHCGRPKVLCVVLWKPTLREGGLSRPLVGGPPRPLVGGPPRPLVGGPPRPLVGGPPRPERTSRAAPILVTQWDPETGETSELAAPGFNEPAGEAFWAKTMDSVRTVVRQRGWPDRCIMLGQAFDVRPLPEVQDLFRKIAPYARWVVFSHFRGDPGLRDGKLILSGGMEVGYREDVAGGLLGALFPERPELQNRPYLSAGAHRIELRTWSPPPTYRNLAGVTGTFCRIGLDFWPVPLAARDAVPPAARDAVPPAARDAVPPAARDAVPTREGVVGTLFDPEICGSWLYKSNPMAITTPGPEGALPTVRFQMLREGVQETEVRIFLVQSLDRLPEPRRQQLRRLLDEWVGARRVARVLSGAQVSLDGQRLTSRMIAAAAEIAGEQSPARWETPPEVVSSLFDAE